ncbi:MAG: hypothetical protein JWO73_656 [Candidatus Taylorbacteria bacterium]|nr:hypothetical protein [Candidatus Taylorbacteria bacterium]
MNMKKISIFIVAIIILSLAAVLLANIRRAATPPPETPSTAIIPRSDSTVLPFGKATLALQERAALEGISIRPVSIVEESRCATGVQCIQAGTVRIKLEIVSGMGTSTEIIGLGKSVIVDGKTVAFTDAAPYPAAGKRIPDEAYRFIFSIEKK